MEELKANIVYTKEGLNQVDIILDEVVSFGKNYGYENIVSEESLKIIKQHLQIVNAELTREFDKVVSNPETFYKEAK
jgi:hypothetical protein